MPPTDNVQVSKETWQLCQSLLSPAIGESLAPAADDPVPFRKHGGDVNIIRLRILPRKKAPPKFWNATKCFYELGIGQYDGQGLCLGGVAFLQHSAQQVCGSGYYQNAVYQILTDVHKKRPQDFQLGNSSDGGASLPILRRRYHVHTAQKFFPVDLAAHDLAWLIVQTLPRFQQLPPATI